MAKEHSNSGLPAVPRKTTPRWRLHVAAFLLLLLPGTPGCTLSQEAPATAPAAPISFSEADRQLILDFYREFDFPPEIADPAIIAPDLEQRLETTATLPPGLAAVPLPMKLEQTLTPLPPGYVRFRAGSAVVLMDVRTWEVVDQVPVEFR
jgi:hypothetical protein